MSKEKSKYEKKETAVTRATFTLDEIRSFALTGYAKQRRDLYLQKVAERQENPRMINGLEVLSPISMVAEVDMMPLSTRANMARFSKYGSEIVGSDGYDADQDDDSDESFFSSERSENPPSPHELRTVKLNKKLNKALKAKKDDTEGRRSKGDTPTPDGDENPSLTTPEPKAAPSNPKV